VTLEIGGNDLLNIFFDLVLPGTCPSLKEAPPSRCGVLATPDAPARTWPRRSTACRRRTHLLIVLMTLYNPFSGGLTPIDEMAELALEGSPDTEFPEGLNDIIRAEGREQRVIL
jgi:hypothetical protein